MIWINALLQGLLLGGLYALLAAGLSLMFGVMRIVNLAHGVLAVVAAYLSLVLVENFGVSPFLTLTVVVPAVALLGYALQRGLFNPALRVGSLSPLLVSFGLSVVFAQLLQGLFTADTRSIQIGDLGTSSLTITSDIAIGTFSFISFVIGVLMIAGLQFLLSRTAIGRAMRAASDDTETVKLMGVNSRHLYGIATAIALATVGLAGVFLGMRTQFSPTLGDSTLIFAFEAVIIGGLGSLWGTLAGGILLAVAQSLGAQAAPAYGVLAGHVLFLLVLAFRPQGLFPKVVNG